MLWWTVFVYMCFLTLSLFFERGILLRIFPRYPCCMLQFIGFISAFTYSKKKANYHQ